MFMQHLIEGGYLLAIFKLLALHFASIVRWANAPTVLGHSDLCDDNVLG
jgi:hypothetical protein